FQAEDGIRDLTVTGVQTCALPISEGSSAADLYVVHTDHDAPDLVAALERLFARRPRFVGLMGSRRHTGHHLEALRERGLPAADRSEERRVGKEGTSRWRQNLTESG